MSIKNTIATSLAALITVNLAFADAPIISGVMAQLENPWDGKVYISYRVTGDIAATAKERGLVTSLKVTATDNDSNETYTATALSGDMGLTAGSHSLVWDISEESFCLKSTNVMFRVSYEKVPALYCVVDLSAGSSAASYPVTYLSGPPSGGFNTDEYKTTKLVLRRIEQGTYKMQGTSNVTLTKPFYIGVFEMTQKQYQMVAGNNPSYYKGDQRPVENVNYNTIRGSSNGAKWPSSSTVDSSSFMGKFQSRTGLAFDLPTESQWECACRAGMTSSYNNGGWAEGDLNTLGRYSRNVSDGKGGYSGTHTTVGSYAANAWGLYDMHGNAMEWCLDWFDTRTYGTDPKGPSSGSSRVAKGGTWWRDASGCTSSSRYKRSPADTNHEAGYGFRIARTMSNVETSGSICYGVSEPVTVNLIRSEPWDFSENLVAHYEFDGNADDTSGNGNDGILHDVTPTADRHGNIDSAYHFNGTSAYIEVPDSDSLCEVGQTVSVSAWVKADGWYNDSWISILTKGNKICRQYGPAIGKDKWSINFYNGTSENGLYVDKPFMLNKWNHIVAIYTPTLISAYLNGELVGTMMPVGSIVENHESLYIGYDPPGADEYLNGDLDEVRI